MSPRTRMFPLAFMFGLGACAAVPGTDAGGGASASGGTNASGGVSASGGASASGGTSASGGIRASGGAYATGGTNASGGVSPSGGAIGSGGVSASGGADATGGTNASGGVSASGGATPDAGASGGATPDASADASGSSTQRLLVPAQGAWLGAFVGTGTLAQLETTLGRKLAIVHHFFGWSDDFTTQAAAELSANRMPLITWETWTNGTGFPLTDIVNGAHDTMIRSRAQAAKALAKPFFLRWGHEMNGNWYPWDGTHNGANQAATATYVSAYRHIHDLFVAAGATNVLWVFSPNVDSVPGDGWNQWSNYYPGDGYVDWMGFDGYNWGTSQSTSTWRSFPNLAGAIYASLAAKGKPIMIPETASAELGGDKAGWIASILPSLQSSFPAIKALVWFHMNKETDWRVDSSPAAKNAFMPMALDPYFNP